MRLKPNYTLLFIGMMCLLLAAAYGVLAQDATPDPALSQPSEAENEAIPPGRTSSDPVIRGEYLFRVEFACIACHGTYSEGGPIINVNPLTSTAAGGAPFEFPGAFTVYAANLTGMVDWSDEQLEIAIRFGLRPSGTGLAPIMPFPLYQQITEQDMDDLIAYIRTMEPVSNNIPNPEFVAEGLSRQVFGQLYQSLFDMNATPPEPDFSDPLQRGTYLANVSMCMYCHGELNPQTGMPAPYPDGLPWGDLVGTSLLPFNLSSYTDEELDNLFHTGVEEDGEVADGMPWPSFRHMAEGDHEALIAWMRQLPDVQQEDRQAATPESSG